MLEYLDDLYIDVGHHGDRLITKEFEGREGLAKIGSLMDALRAHPPRQIGGLTLTEAFDYQSHEVRSLGRAAAPRPLPRPADRLADLSHRSTWDPICGAAVRNRAQDQVLPLCADRGRWA